MASTIIKRIISTAKAPRPAAPYNQAIVVDRTVYLSGVLGIDKDSGKLVAGGAVPEAVKALENMQNILAAAGSKVDNVVKCTVLLNDIADFGAVNQEYTKGNIQTSLLNWLSNKLFFPTFSVHIELPSTNMLPSRQTSTGSLRWDWSHRFDRRRQNRNCECWLKGSRMFKQIDWK